MSNTIFDGPKVTLEDMLEAREGRSLRQQSLLAPPFFQQL